VSDWLTVPQFGLPTSSLGENRTCGAASRPRRSAKPAQKNFDKRDACDAVGR
jgi:hypothetical protein